MQYLWAFIVGGLVCVIAQILIDRTKLTPARILVGYVVAGAILSALGIYEYSADFAGAGASCVRGSANFSDLKRDRFNVLKCADC